MLCWLLLECGLLTAWAAVLPPPWASPRTNPCAARPGGWQLLHWPSDGRCYRIFQQGPCPDTMELAPRRNGTAECRCPPGTAQSPRDALCHRLYSSTPCALGEYFIPIPTRSRKLWGTCREAESCDDEQQAFWPQDEHCYQLHTRGPCASGRLVVRGVDGLAACMCSAEGELAGHHWGEGDACYQHFTLGPCSEGTLFLPGGVCGCPREPPHFHPPTGRCFQTGLRGPCPPGHVFLAGACVCEDQHVLWEGDGACYRPYTRGPCNEGQVLLNSTACTPHPCQPGWLYFPAHGCHRVGTRGPCLGGQLVLYEGGGSQRGACGCAGPEPCLTSKVEEEEEDRCEARVAGQCYQLYQQGPCPQGQWLVPHSRCECMPGHEATATGTCLPPNVRLAKFLNNNYSSH